MEPKATHPPEKELPAPRLTKDWKYYTGMTFLVLSLILPLFGFIVPFLGLPAWLAASIIGLLSVGGPEVMILIAVAFLGKETIQYFKARFWAWLKRPRLIQPVTRWRYYLGLSIMIGSALPHYFKSYFPLLLPSNQEAQFYILMTSDLLFVLSFFIAGDEFWEKFKKLFVYEGAGTANIPPSGQ